MPAVKVDIGIEAGTTWQKSWRVKWGESPDTAAYIDDSWTMKAELRQDFYPSELLYTFEGGVTADGVVVISVNPDASELWTFDGGRYDVKVFGPEGTPELRIAKGRVTVDRQVTV